MSLIFARAKTNFEQACFYFLLVHDYIAMNPFSNSAPKETMSNASAWHPNLHLQSVASCSSLACLIDNDHDKRPELYQLQQPNAAAIWSITPCSSNGNIRGDTDIPVQVPSCSVKDLQVNNRHASETSGKFNRKSPIGEGQGQEAFQSCKSGAATTAGIPLLHHPRASLEQPQSALQSKSPSQSQSQKRKVVSTNGVVSPLHRLCCRQSVTVSEVKAILAVDPGAIRRRVGVRTINQARNHKTTHAHGHRHLRREPLTLPLNLAIHHKVSSDVILFLLDADPAVCLKPDGSMLESSLHILLRIGHRRDLFQLVDSFLNANLACAWTTDGRNQVPLHVTIAYGAELNVVRRLCTAHPQALYVRNRCGQTVMDMAGHRHLTCPNVVAEYLWQFTTLVQEKETQELDDSLLFP
jgi:hypothetical protein